MIPLRRKKWTEAEEKTLIDKYGQMVSDGTLGKMKTREKKYRPIAVYVNSVHHLRDPTSYTWQWTWKDVSTKVQNMRHQYLLVKQKIKKPELSVENSGGGECSGDEFDWVEGLTHWSNFLRYKEVFGDVPGPCNSNSNGNGHGHGNDLMNVGIDGGFVGEEDRGLEIMDFSQIGHSGDGDFAGIDTAENEVLALGFGYDGEGEGEGEGEDNYNGNAQGKDDGDDGFVYEEVEPNGSNLKRKRKALKGIIDKKTFGFLSNQLRNLKELEARFDQRDAERERDRKRRDNLTMEREREWERKFEAMKMERVEKEKALESSRRQKMQELEAKEKEDEEKERRRRREEELVQEKEWEERMNRKRIESKNRIDEMLRQHHSEMGQMQTRMLHEQQNLTNQLLGIISQWTGHSSGISDHTSANNHYLSQIMQNLHHVNGMVHEDSRVEGDNQDDQFIVDG